MGMEAGLLTTEDLPMIVARTIRRELADRNETTLNIDLLSSVDGDGWCIGQLGETGEFVKLAARADLVENEFISCGGLHASIVAYTWSARTRAALVGALQLGGYSSADEEQISNAAIMLALGQSIGKAGVLTANGVTAQYIEDVSVAESFETGDWLPEMGATATYDASIIQTFFFEPKSGATAYLGTPARLPERTLSTGQVQDVEILPMFAITTDWKAFDLQGFAMKPHGLPRDVYALSEYSEDQWAFEGSNGFQVILRDRYISSSATEAVLTLVQSASVPSQFLPVDIRAAIEEVEIIE